MPVPDILSRARATSGGGRCGVYGVYGQRRLNLNF